MIITDACRFCGGPKVILWSAAILPGRYYGVSEMNEQDRIDMASNALKRRLLSEREVRVGDWFVVDYDEIVIGCAPRSLNDVLFGIANGAATMNQLEAALEEALDEAVEVKVEEYIEALEKQDADSRMEAEIARAEYDKVMGL